MPLLQVCPTLNDRTPDNPWPQREQVPKETYAALPADADLIREATARLSKAPAQAPALVAQTPRVAEAETPMPPPPRRPPPALEPPPPPPPIATAYYGE